MTYFAKIVKDFSKQWYTKDYEYFLYKIGYKNKQQTKGTMQERDQVMLSIFSFN